MKTVIFDLDGTLADTSGDLIDATNTCFQEMGLAPQLAYGADDALALRGARAMLREGFARLGETDVDAEVERLFPQFVTHYAAQLDKHSYLYDGAMDAVERLKSKGYRVGICTNKPGAQAEELLQRFGVRQAFGSMIAADTLPFRKPDPRPLFEAILRAGGDPARAVLVGDTVTDRETARNADVPCVLVTFSPVGHAVSELDPEALLHDYSQIECVIHPLIG